MGKAGLPFSCVVGKRRGTKRRNTIKVVDHAFQERARGGIKNM